jgi:pyridoxine 4-dehydrogenase
MSLRRLGLERIDLYQLHRVDPAVPVEDSLGELVKLREEGKIRHIGLSEVSATELEHAAALTEIVSVQNLYNVAARDAEPVLKTAERHGMVFIPWFPMATGELARPGGKLDALSTHTGAARARLAAAEFPRDAADPRHLQRRPPRREPRGHRN